MYHHAKIRYNWSIHFGDIAIFPFFKMLLSAILDLLGAYSKHPWKALGDLCHEAKFGSNQCNSSDKFRQLLHLAWKQLTMPPKLSFIGDLTPKWVAISGKPQNGTSLCDSTLFEPLSAKISLTCRWLTTKGINKKNSVIFHPFAQEPTVDELAPNLLLGEGREHKSSVQNFLSIGSGTWILWGRGVKNKLMPLLKPVAERC